MLLWGLYASLKCFDITVSGVWGPFGSLGGLGGVLGRDQGVSKGFWGAQTGPGIALSRLGRSMGILAALLGACTMQKCCSRSCRHIF